MSAIQINNLTLSFGKQPIINNFTVTLNTGEFIGIFGPNGAGKSTLLRALLGLIKPTQGNIQILSKSIGYMSQFRSHGHAHQLSAKAYLLATVGGLRWGFPYYTRSERASVNQVIALTQIEHFVDRPYSQLSGGEKQRVALAQTLLGKPNILLLDEPLSGLDPAQQEKLVTLIESVQKKLNMTVLFTAHDMNPLLGIMDRIIYLAHGRAAIGTVAEVVNNEQLSFLYDAPIEVIKHGKHVFVIHEKLGTNIYAHDHATH